VSKREKRVSRAPLRTEAEDEYTPRHPRVAPARQLCSGSNRELVDRPRDDRCPVCEKRVTPTVVRGRHQVREFNFGGTTDLKDARVVDEVYVIPAHLMRHKT
jgi:hypothetical protein